MKHIKNLIFWNNNKQLRLNTYKLTTTRIFPSTYQGTDFLISKAQLNLGYAIAFGILQGSWNLAISTFEKELCSSIYLHAIHITLLEMLQVF